MFSGCLVAGSVYTIFIWNGTDRLSFGGAYLPDMAESVGSVTCLGYHGKLIFFCIELALSLGLNLNFQLKHWFLIVTDMSGRQTWISHIWKKLRRE